MFRYHFAVVKAVAVWDRIINLRRASSEAGDMN